MKMSSTIYLLLPPFQALDQLPPPKRKLGRVWLERQGLDWPRDIGARDEVSAA